MQNKITEQLIEDLLAGTKVDTDYIVNHLKWIDELTSGLILCHAYNRDSRGNPVTMSSIALDEYYRKNKSPDGEGV